MMCSIAFTLVHSFTHLLSILTFVLFAGMSRKPLTLSTSKMIFNDLNVRGFWLSRWVQENSVARREEMLSELAQMFVAGQLKSNVEIFAFEEFAQAYQRSQQGFRNKKVLIKF